jgi:hypothetical protein
VRVSEHREQAPVTVSFVRRRVAPRQQMGLVGGRLSEELNKKIAQRWYGIVVCRRTQSEADVMRARASRGD